MTPVGSASMSSFRRSRQALVAATRIRKTGDWTSFKSGRVLTEKKGSVVEFQCSAHSSRSVTSVNLLQCEHTFPEAFRVSICAVLEDLE